MRAERTHWSPISETRHATSDQTLQRFFGITGEGEAAHRENVNRVCPSSSKLPVNGNGRDERYLIVACTVIIDVPEAAGP